MTTKNQNIRKLIKNNYNSQFKKPNILRVRHYWVHCKSTTDESPTEDFLSRQTNRLQVQDESPTRPLAAPCSAHVRDFIDGITAICRIAYCRQEIVAKRRQFTTVYDSAPHRALASLSLRGAVVNCRCYHNFLFNSYAIFTRNS